MTSTENIIYNSYHKASDEKAGETNGCNKSNLQHEPFDSQQNYFKLNDFICCSSLFGGKGHI